MSSLSVTLPLTLPGKVKETDSPAYFFAKKAGLRALDHAAAT
jgi:hypothetical protein